jgi:dTDP-4-dehydrorhamnose reductase
MLRLARERKELAVVNDQIGSPTWARALAESSGELLGRIAGRTVETGVYHLSAEGYTSRFDLREDHRDRARDHD